MKHLIVLGSTAIGRVICDYAKMTPEYNKVLSLYGFLNFSEDNTKISDKYPKIIGTIEGYKPTEDDVFICGYVDVNDREKAVTTILEKGGEFVNIIHPLANVCSSAEIGTGNFVGAFTTVSVDVKLGNHCIIQDHCNIGHDNIINDFTNLFVGCVVCGLSEIGCKATLYTRAIIYPKVNVGNNTIVGAASVVMRKIKDGDMVVGNPAKKLEVE